MSLQSCEVRGAPKSREVFVSYRRLDDEPPPGKSKDCGFVCYLLRQLRYDLRQMGVPDAILWQDRAQIEIGDIFSESIQKALNSAELFVAVLSKNYVTSSWCQQELSTMESRIAKLDKHAGQRRIFRVDKHSVPEHQVPEALRRVQAIRFYYEDDDGVNEYYWRGKVRRTVEYERALRDLAKAICKRLEELGIPLQPRIQLQPPLDYNIRPSNGRVVFVAKPASDMIESYWALVSELQGSGYRVTPDSDSDFGQDARSAVVNALAEAEASIHLLGNRTGGRPDGLDIDLVPMQLAAAADEARKRASFVRMIWAPKVLPPETSARGGIVGRDPLSIVDRFGERLQTDQIDGDTASRFNEFVFQRLGRKQSNPGPQRRTAYIRAPGRNRDFGVTIAKELKRVGLLPILNPLSPATNVVLARVEQGLFSQAHHIVICWGTQSHAKILTEIATVQHAWKTVRPAGGKLILLLTPPTSKSKAEVVDLDIPYVDHVVDARDKQDAASIGQKLVSTLGVTSCALT
jgi:TIR domain